jgi:hypothetical protein
MHMLMAFFSWWYGEGWKRQLEHVSDRMVGLIDMFSIDLILRTLFAPFRQISAGRTDGPIAVQFRAFLDKTISRGIGAMVRLAVLIAGSITIVFSGFVGVLYLLVWPLLPVLPFIGFIMMASGWVPLS